MLTLENVSLRYGSFQALDGVSLNAKEGELVVLLGANGAGKSSIFLTTSGIHRAAGGSIRFHNQELVGMRAAQIVQSGVVQCPEGRKLFPGMSVLKNLMLGAYVHRRDSAGNKLTDRISYTLDLASLSNQAASIIATNTHSASRPDTAPVASGRARVRAHSTRCSSAGSCVRTLASRAASSSSTMSDRNTTSCAATPSCATMLR